MTEHTEVTERTARVAHEAIRNLQINDWSAMDDDALESAEEELAEVLEIPESLR